MMLTLFFALSAILIRLALFYFGYESAETSKYVFLVHILFILLSIFFSVLQFRRFFPEKTGFTTYLKHGLKGGAVYSVILTAFLWVFYGAINEDTFTAKRENLIAQQIENQDLAEAEQVKARENIENFFTPFNYSTISFLGFLFISVFYSVGVALLFHFMPRLRV